MTFREDATTYRCAGELCVAITSIPLHPVRQGILVIVGGPQYRVGSHRQFTLLCRALAARGVAAMRFDYRGMGDSEGDARTFEDIGTDICAAIDAFFSRIPQLHSVAIFGLCDAATAAAFYAHGDSRVSGLILLNPWVRTDSGIARAHLEHYYLARLVDWDFWQKVVRGELAIGRSLGSFLTTLRTSLTGGKAGAAGRESGSSERAKVALPVRMAQSLARFRGEVLLILSGKDLTAQEFVAAARTSEDWRTLLSSSLVQRCELPLADHTCSRREWRDQIADWTADWLLDGLNSG